MRKLNQFLFVLLYIMAFLIIARLGMFDGIISWLMTPTRDGATYLQVVIIMAALVGVVVVWLGMIKEGLEVEQNEQSKN